MVVILINFYPHYILDASSDKKIADTILGYMYCERNDDDKFALLIERHEDVFRDVSGT